MLKTILSVLSCSKPINIERFRTYCLEAARKYVALYGWYYMPPTVHVVLIHGHKIIQNVQEKGLTIKDTDEEVQEHLNKFIKRYRENFTAKISR